MKNNNMVLMFLRNENLVLHFPKQEHQAII